MAMPTNGPWLAAAAAGRRGLPPPTRVSRCRHCPGARPRPRRIGCCTTRQGRSCPLPLRRWPSPPEPAYATSDCARPPLPARACMRLRTCWGPSTAPCCSDTGRQCRQPLLRRPLRCPASPWTSTRCHRRRGGTRADGILPARPARPWATTSMAVGRIPRRWSGAGPSKGPSWTCVIGHWPSASSWRGRSLPCPIPPQPKNSCPTCGQQAWTKAAWMSWASRRYDRHWMPSMPSIRPPHCPPSCLPRQHVAAMRCSSSMRCPTWSTPIA